MHRLHAQPGAAVPPLSALTFTCACPPAEPYLVLLLQQLPFLLPHVTTLRLQDCIDYDPLDCSAHYSTLSRRLEGKSISGLSKIGCPCPPGSSTCRFDSVGQGRLAAFADGGPVLGSPLTLEMVDGLPPDLTLQEVAQILRAAPSFQRPHRPPPAGVSSCAIECHFRPSSVGQAAALVADMAPRHREMKAKPSICDCRFSIEVVDRAL